MLTDDSVFCAGVFPCVFKYLTYSHFYTLGSLRSQTFSHARASCLCLLWFRLTRTHADILLVPAAHLPQRLPLKLSVHTLWLSQWKIRKWHPCISVSSAWHSESGHQRRWSSGEWGGRWQRSQRLADGRVSSWDHVLLYTSMFECAAPCAPSENLLPLPSTPHHHPHLAFRNTIKHWIKD